MSEHGESPITDYPHGRGYGHDYMRGGEIFGGYGYSERQEYELRRGELSRAPDDHFPGRDQRSTGTISAEGGGGAAMGDSGGDGGARR